MYVNRQELMAVLLGALEEELPEKNQKERIVIAEAVVDALDGPILAVVEEDEDEVDDSEDDSYEMDE